MLKLDLALDSIAEGSPPTLLREFRHRRPTWRSGRRVALNDGVFWWLPPLDLALISTCRPFRRDANIALTLAAQLDEAPAEGQAVFLRSAVYHAQMAQMGVTLLQQNYQLELDHWMQLISFPRLGDLLGYSKVVAEAFADSVAVWQSLLVGGRFVD